MAKSILEISQRKAALIAGLGLLLMTIVFLLADSLIFQKLIIAGDAKATANNIITNEFLFRAGICSYVIVIILDILVAWILYVFLKPVNKNLSLLSGWFRLAYSIIFAMALANYLNVLQLLSSADYLAVFEIGQLHARVMFSLNAFSEGWALGLIFFGFHLSILGYVAFKSDYIPKFFGIILLIGGVSYVIDYSAKILFSNFDVIFSLVFGWGELLYMFWLLYKGIRKPELKD